MEESWKPVTDYEDLYEISNLGNIRNNKGMLLSPRLDNGGYKYINLSRNSNKKTYKIHRLVAIHFISNPDNKPCVNHKDGARVNNFVDNLEWVTYSENATHSYLFNKRNTSSRYPGVDFHKHTNKWRSRISIEGKLIHLGMFEQEMDAKSAFDKAVIEYGIDNKYYGRLSDANVYQDICLSTLLPQSDNIYYMSLGLANEAGEVLGVIKKVIRDKNGKITNDDKEKIKAELGDVLYYIAVMASKIGLQLSDILEYNIEKLQSRKERGVLQGSGDER